MASRLLLRRNNILAQQADAQLLINHTGDWLQHRDTSQYTSWTIAQTETFNNSYPDAWRHMQAAESGQFKTSKGLFTFATLYPTGLHGAASSDAQSASWIIASLITTDSLAAIAMSEFRDGMLIYLLLLLPTAVCCFYIARMMNSRLQNQRRIRALSAAVEQSHDMVLITDAAGSIRYVNPRFEEITGYNHSEITGGSPNLLKSGRHDSAFYQRLWDTISSGEAFEATITNRKKSGELFHIQMTISPLSDKSGIIGYVASSKDITGQVNTQERLLKLAFHHPLTGLPNRSLFRDHLHDAAARARRSHHKVAVLFIDLDRFKQVNDSLGHQTGDALLISVAQRLREAVREIDMVAHLGGDEFTILLDAIEHLSQVQAVTTKLLQLFEQPFSVNERELYIDASIGIAIFPTDSDNVESLVEQADTAMYQAKRAGRGHFQFYSAQMTTLANERLELESQLRTALHQQEFKLLFQPIVDPILREMRGLEALIRWHQPDGTVRPPDDFIPILEETGMIVPITAWILGEACRQYRHLHAAGLGRVRINVNISARSFYQSDLVEVVRKTLEQNRMPAAQLVLEVTESLLLEDQRRVQGALEQLRELGVSIAIDDFGTGYSSLAYLRRLPISIIKIDRTFIHGVGADTRDAALVSAMIAVAQELQMDVVAEGVEHAHQLDFLRQRHCRGAQGFLFSPPVSAGHIHDWLDQDPHWPWKTWMNQRAADRLH
jgi:diguanylate cyclase (GGDEF)-like protein/PAS domain S-box-containing protein